MDYLQHVSLSIVAIPSIFKRLVTQRYKNVPIMLFPKSHLLKFFISPYIGSNEVYLDIYLLWTNISQQTCRIAKVNVDASVKNTLSIKEILVFHVGCILFVIPVEQLFKRLKNACGIKLVASLHQTYKISYVRKENIKSKEKHSYMVSEMQEFYY